jgi:integrase/recombinase XerC
MILDSSKFLENTELDTLRARLVRLSCRDEVLLALASETGARASEILNLRPEDLRPDCTVFIKGLKRSRDREIPIRPELMVELRRYIPFRIKLRRFEYIWGKYRPCNKKLHSLRHTFALNLYLRHKDPKLVQLALGHKSFSSTQVYLDFVYSKESLRRILL